MSDIEVGSVVTLKSGGVVMTVGSIGNAGAHCYWQVEGKGVNECYPLPTLKLYVSPNLGRH